MGAMLLVDMVNRPIRLVGEFDFVAVRAEPYHAHGHA